MQSIAQVKVFIISLDRAVERRKYIRRLLMNIGLQAEVVSAVDGQTLTREQRSRYNGSRARRIYGCEMSSNEIACYLSHLSIYERMVREEIGAALVLEDDISCATDLPGVLAELARLPRSAWQVIRLQTSKRSVAGGYTSKARGVPVAEIGPRNVYRLRTGVLGGCAYLIQRSAAAAMLARSRTIDMPIDQTLDRYWENGIVPYVLRPMPVWHDDVFESEIGARGRTLAQTSPALLARRRLQRLVDAFNKRIFWLSFRVPSLGVLMSRLGLSSARMALRALWSAPAAYEA